MSKFSQVVLALLLIVIWLTPMYFGFKIGIDAYDEYQKLSQETKAVQENYKTLAASYKVQCADLRLADIITGNHDCVIEKDKKIEAIKKLADGIPVLQNQKITLSRRGEKDVLMEFSSFKEMGYFYNLAVISDDPACKLLVEPK